MVGNRFRCDDQFLVYCFDELETGVNEGFGNVDAAFLRWQEYDAAKFIQLGLTAMRFFLSELIR
jgi:hypothetical protein